MNSTGGRNQVHQTQAHCQQISTSTGGIKNSLGLDPESILPYARDTSFLNVKNSVRNFYTDEKFAPVKHPKFQDRHDYRL